MPPEYCATGPRAPRATGRRARPPARSGDPRRSLELLWRTHQPAARGPKQRLDLDQIVGTAIEVLDAEGLGTLSMRKVAERLGVGTMSFYTYVPGKSELVDLMFDQAVAGPNERVEGPWRERLEQIAHENWWRYHRHPWLLEIAAGARVRARRTEHGPE
jgi:AcrR family transcriptional regulator